MKVRIEVIFINEDGSENRSSVTEIQRQELVMETFGLSIAEGKTILREVQDFITTQQITEYLELQRNCHECGQRLPCKQSGTSDMQTVFGTVTVPNPRWEQCSCQKKGSKTFRPMSTCLQGRITPERLYLESKWGSLIPYEKVAELLKEVLPVSESINHETIRKHLHSVAKRMEAELGEERKPDPILPEVTTDLPLPDGPMSVGIDGGYVRAAHKGGCFEVIAGRSVVAFRRDPESSVPPSKCFGYVQTYDSKPRRRIWELMQSQGMQENQQVVFLSDGGEDVRQVQEYLHPNGQHLLDWFHITMRLTVLQQQAKALREDQPENWNKVSKQVESIKHLLWHGNTEEALDRLSELQLDLDCTPNLPASLKKLSTGLKEFETYIRNNQASIPNYGERHRQGETISTAFVESTINQVVSRRFVKKQQMHWTPQGAHLLLQTRTKVLNNELEEVFRRWYPLFRPSQAA